MQFKSTNVLEFFDSSQKCFVIPVYQRAYSWESDNWDTFLNDLKEQIKGNNNYFYGNLLLEIVKKGVRYEVIDGQQRLTTISIFIRSIINVLKKRNSKETIEIDFEEKETIYLKNGGNIKLRIVEYDRACYETLIVDGKNNFSIASPSQNRILNARNHFMEELGKLSTEELIQIFDKIEESELTCIELQGKKDSALMFELQNNRGRDLTNMEKLKSYFMYQVYVYSAKDETESNVEHISDIFKAIYQIIHDLKSINEDSVLIYHCNTYLSKGYAYRTIDDIKKEFADSADKVKWIKDFISELHTSFSNMKKMERSNLTFLMDLRNLIIPVFVYSFIIKGFKCFGEDNTKLNTLYHILEIVVFRYRLVHSRADIISRLNEVLIGFDGDLQKLKQHFKEKINNTYYWDDQRVKDKLDGYMYRNHVLHYLLWKYEDNIQNKGYNINKVKIKDEQIEHISPQTPTDGDPLASGYEVTKENYYDDNFLEEHLNCVGNLMLISGAHNASIGNKPFKEKLGSYNSNPLLRQQAEIKTFSINNKWTKESIDDRHEKIVKFSINKWSFDSVKINNINK